MCRIFKFIALLLCCVSAVHAEDIANCQSPSGHVYFTHRGVIGKSDAGWTTDKITSGKFTLTRNSQRKYDLLFVDASKRVTSTVADGGNIVLMRHYADDAAFIIAYADTLEIYNFWKDAAGKLQFSMLQNRGSGSAVSKSSVLVGQCEFIKFDLIR
jgi:hypothetical protein